MDGQILTAEDIPLARTPTEERSDDALPATVQTLMQARIDRLAPSDREALRARMLARVEERAAARAAWRIGEPYRDIAARMTAAIERARIAAAGHEAVCVSHQLPVETLRRAMLGKNLHHFPTKRMCNLASVTSFYFHGDQMVGWGYAELAGQ